MKKLLAALMLTTILLAGCAQDHPDPQPTAAPEKKETIITTEANLMENTKQTHECVSLSEELSFTWKKDKTPNTVTEAFTWVMNELVLNSEGTYQYNEITLDLKLTDGETTYVIPGFWDGGNVWRVRFVCPKAGTWTYETVCSNGDKGLNGVTGTVNCKPYEGKLAIYRHGFVKTVPGTKYFMYDDGTPFFYLGDTHWSLSGEPLKNFKEVTKKRAEQGFTVIQSEPLGASFNLADGMSKGGDTNGLQKFDEYFFEIADKGFVHANASLFFPSAMESFIKKFGGYSDKQVGVAMNPEKQIVLPMYDLADGVKKELESLSRYWVARYGAFPVMWTMGQEVDNDFYWNGEKGSHPEWSYVNNPFVLEAEYFGKYDAYKHPLSAHQEGMNTTAASDSAFRNCSAHTWYAAQWKWLHFDTPVDYKPLKDFWENGQGKPMVDYEGYYCYLWTKNFGARAQGWMAFTIGGCGYGWGGQDTWCYKSTYDEDKDCSYDHVDVVTAKDKKDATWKDALEFESTYQMTYMRDFLEHTVGAWWELLPRFDDAAYFTPESSKVLYCMAGTEKNDRILMYFYNFSDAALAEKPNATEEQAKKTGTLGSLDANTDYVYVWFDPVTGQKTGSGKLTSDAEGKARLPQKTTGDMVLYIVKAEREA